MSKEKREGYTLIFRSFITTKSGKRVYASQCGLKAFPIWVADKTA
ncbi:MULTISPECIES: hypothetical protein [Gilliamella]|nr:MULTISPECIES: hypothetical protein [Gilliamella]